MNDFVVLLTDWQQIWLINVHLENGKLIIFEDLFYAYLETIDSLT